MYENCSSSHVAFFSSLPLLIQLTRPRPHPLLKDSAHTLNMAQRLHLVLRALQGEVPRHWETSRGWPIKVGDNKLKIRALKYQSNDYLLVNTCIWLVVTFFLLLSQPHTSCYDYIMPIVMIQNHAMTISL